MRWFLGHLFVESTTVAKLCFFDISGFGHTAIHSIGNVLKTLLIL